MTVQKILWHLPRPSSTYKGSYPLHFEKKFKKLINCDYLHVFSGTAKTGLRVDIKFENKPDIVADAHYLPFKDNTFPASLADPPYSKQLAKELYQTPELKEKLWVSELVRVTKPGGKIALYHWYQSPRPKGCKYWRILVILTRIRHFARICCIFIKEEHTQTSITHYGTNE